MLPTFLEHSSTIHKLLTRELDLNSQSQFFKASYPFLFPFDLFAQEYMAKYHLLLLEFLGDPRRSKEFYIDGDKFATLATTFAKNISTPLYVSLFSLLSNYVDCFESWSGVILILHKKIFWHAFFHAFHIVFSRHHHQRILHSSYKTIKFLLIYMVATLKQLLQR